MDILGRRYMLIASAGVRVNSFKEEIFGQN